MTYIPTNLQQKESAPAQVIIQPIPSGSGRGGLVETATAGLAELGKSKDGGVRCFVAYRPLGRGWAGPRAVKCFCWLVRGKPRQPVTGGRVGSGAAQTRRGTGARGVCSQLARASANRPGVGFLPSSPRTAAPALRDVSHHHPALYPPLRVSVPCLWLPGSCR